MLIVAPSGNTDPATDLSTPRFFSAHEMDTGSVALEEEGEFIIVASTEKEEIEKKYNNYFYQLTFNQEINSGIARDSLNVLNNNKEDLDINENERYWEVGMPISENGKKIGVLSMKVSSKIIDNLTSENKGSSLYLLFGEIVTVILFLLLAVRFWDYALLYRKAKDIDQMKDEFISIASHELRTPVTGIKGYSSMILDGSFGEINEKIKNGAQIIQNASERLGVLVDDLLNVSRIEQGKMEFKKEKVNIYKTVKDVLDELRVQVDMKKLNLKFLVHNENLPFINIDSEKLKQILINIIGNSIKYTEKGTILVSTYVKDNKYLALSIKDTGIGMNEEERRRLFQKFYRVQNEKTKKVTGTGLGLWITKKMVEMMDGKIMVDSIKGAGSEFTIIFPIIK
jgi:signal transduction histidine kinase